MMVLVMVMVVLMMMVMVMGVVMAAAVTVNVKQFFLILRRHEDLISAILARFRADAPLCSICVLIPSSAL